MAQLPEIKASSAEEDNPLLKLTGRPSDHQVKEIRERIRSPTGKSAVEAIHRAIDK